MKKKKTLSSQWDIFCSLPIQVTLFFFFFPELFRAGSVLNIQQQQQNFSSPDDFVITQTSCLCVQQHGQDRNACQVGGVWKVWFCGKTLENWFRGISWSSRTEHYLNFIQVMGSGLLIWSLWNTAEESAGQQRNIRQVLDTAPQSWEFLQSSAFW